METESFAFVNGLMMWGTLGLQIGALVLLLGLLRVKGFGKAVSFARVNALSLSFLLALFAALGSFYYSSIAGFAPCVLCWYQRIFIFSQIFLLGMAFVRKTRDIFPYTLMLSVVGALLSLYQVVLERFPAVAAICAPGEVSVSCGTIYVEGFSYITIPVMGLTVFVLLILIFVSALSVPREAVLDEVR